MPYFPYPSNHVFQIQYVTVTYLCTLLATCRRTRLRSTRATRNDSDDRGRPRCYERTRRGDRDQAGEHAVARHRDVGLPYRAFVKHIAALIRSTRTIIVLTATRCVGRSPRTSSRVKLITNKAHRAITTYPMLCPDALLPSALNFHLPEIMASAALNACAAHPIRRSRRSVPSVLRVAEAPPHTQFRRSVMIAPMHSQMNLRTRSARDAPMMMYRRLHEHT